MSSFYSEQELNALGFKKLGNPVYISRHATFYGVENMVIGSYVRIDDFCLLSGKITIGSHVHISAYCGLYGSKEIELENYTGLSPRCTVFSASDDFSGNYLISPMVEGYLTNVTGGKVLIKKYSQIGAGCIILPNLTIDEGVAVGAMSFVNSHLPEWSICVGIPAKKIKDRDRGLLDLINR